MKNMFRKFAFVGALNLGLIAFAENEKEEEAKDAQPIQVVCPECTGDHCEASQETVQPVVACSENQ